MIKNLVLSGCGVKIFLYVGILKFLDENNLVNSINRFVGCSAGALFLFFMSLGYTYTEIYELSLGLKLNEITKIDTESVLQFFDKFGMCDMDNGERILRIILKAKTGKEYLTFKELWNINKKELVIVATNIHRYKTVYFSYKDSPDMDIVTAVKMSLCIPILFNPIKYNDEYYVDGGITSHYPIGYIDKSEYDKTLGVIVTPDYCVFKECLSVDLCKNVDKKTEESINEICLKQKATIDSIEEYIFSIIGCPMFTQIQDSYKQHSQFTLLIINNKNSIDFEIRMDEKLSLIDIGYNKISEFYPKLESVLTKEKINKYRDIGVQTD